MSLGSSFSFLKYACLGPTPPNLVSDFSGVIVEDTRAEALAPGVTGSRWHFFLPPVSDLGQ